MGCMIMPTFTCYRRTLVSGRRPLISVPSRTGEGVCMKRMEGVLLLLILVELQSYLPILMGRCACYIFGLSNKV